MSKKISHQANVERRHIKNGSWSPGQPDSGYDQGCFRSIIDLPEDRTKLMEIVRKRKAHKELNEFNWGEQTYNRYRRGK